MPAMKKSFPDQMPVTRWRQSGIRAFTLTELLVVMGSLALLSAVLLSVACTTQERVLRAQCTDNLRQIGVGWNIYQQEFNQVMPCHWKGVTVNVRGTVANPWETHEVYRVIAGTDQLDSGYDGPNIPDGPWNLAVLFATKLVPSPKIFYCPGLARLTIQGSYDYYASVSNIWPSVSGSPGTPGYVRTGYDYYPQLRATIYGGNGLFLPQAAVTPTKWTALDTRKSVATDWVYSYDTLAHRSSGLVAGLNALFPDGHVTFQNARSNPPDFSSQQWGLAGVSGSIGESPNYFRYIMSLWQP
jgi:prepilin-type processing-associated H-X9-DG protein